MTYFIQLVALLWGYVTVCFVISVLIKRNDIADVAWGFGFVGMAWASVLLSKNHSVTGLIVSLLVTIWGVRLSAHIYSRNRKKSEDYRYLAWRKEWGKWVYFRSYFQVYLLQGLFLFIISLPILLLNYTPASSLGLLEGAGVLIWLVGFLIESISDWQLKQFLNLPANKGRLMQTGLWAFSRHPNYFGEVVQWWAIFMLSLGIPWGIIGVISPLTLTFLILKVSGIPMLEQKMNTHPDFPEYKKRVNAFILWWPKKS